MRKNKIRSAVALVVVGALAWGFWPAEDEGAVSVTYTGVSTNGSDQPWFAVTNSSTKSCIYLSWVEKTQFGVWTNVAFLDGRRQSELPGQSVTNYAISIPSTNQWRISVAYAEARLNSSVWRFKKKLSDFAFSRDWYRLGWRLYPAPKIKVAYGPEMLGNKPVAVSDPLNSAPR